MECWEELARLPELLRHFEKHKRESNGQITFSAFLQMHYGTGSKHPDEAPDAEKQQHNSLPSLNGHSLHSYVLPTFSMIAMERPVVTEFQELPDFYWNNLYSFQMQSSLLNPPNFG